MLSDGGWHPCAQTCAYGDQSLVQSFPRQTMHPATVAASSGQQKRLPREAWGPLLVLPPFAQPHAPVPATMHAACASPPSWQLKRRRWWHRVQHCATAFAHERQPQVLVPVLGLGLGLVQGRGQGQMLWHLPQAVLEARVDDEALAVGLAEPILMQLAGQAPQPLAVLQTQMLHAPAMTKTTTQGDGEASPRKLGTRALQACRWPWRALVHGW